MAYWIAFYAGRWKATLFLLILVPFFVSFIIRTVMWKFILADNGIVLGTLKDIGLLPDDFKVLSTWMGVIGGLVYNYLPFAALPLRRARADRRSPTEGATISRDTGEGTTKTSSRVHALRVPPPSSPRS
jgi:ABC-type spermidine/putrescine transport system permease subunit I